MSLRVFAFVLLTAVSPIAASAGPDLKDLRILDDVSATVNACPHLTLQKRVGAIQGVRQVVDQLEVLPASTFDDELRQQIARAIYGNANFWPYAVMRNPPIHIIVDRSRVTLTGLVRSEVDRLLAQALATQFNALSVTNELRTGADLRGRRDPAY